MYGVGRQSEIQPNDHLSLEPPWVNIRAIIISRASPSKASLHIGLLRFSLSPLPTTTRSIKERGNYIAVSNTALKDICKDSFPLASMTTKKRTSKLCIINNLLTVSTYKKQPTSSDLRKRPKSTNLLRMIKVLVACRLALHFVPAPVLLLLP